MNKRLGEIIKERRKARGLSLPQLSRASGVHASYIGRIEQGVRFPSARILRKLAKPLGFGEVELFKLAGYLSQDDTDAQIRKLKEAIKLALTGLSETVDSL